MTSDLLAIRYFRRCRRLRPAVLFVSQGYVAPADTRCGFFPLELAPGALSAEVVGEASVIRRSESSQDIPSHHRRYDAHVDVPKLYTRAEAFLRSGLPSNIVQSPSR